MSVDFGAQDPSALVRRGHLPFADSAKGRSDESAGGCIPTLPERRRQLFCLRSWSMNLISSTTGS